MSPEHVLAFVLFAFVAAITPGPSNFILASTGAAVGVRRGLPCLLGVTMGMGLMMSTVALGLGSVVVDHPRMLTGLQWIGISLLLWLSWTIATAHGSHAAVSSRVVGFWQAAALQWVNPKSWLVTTSAVGAYLPAAADSAVSRSLVVGVLFVLVALPSCLVWLAFGATVQRMLRTARAERGFHIAMGLLLASSIVLFVR